MPELRTAPIFALLALSACTSTASTTDASTPDAAADAGIDAGTDAGPPTPPPMAMTTAGPVIGSASPGVQAFLGIPYAAPPVGSLRWKPPAAPLAWTTPLHVTNHPHACPQYITSLRIGDEDCLFVNVHTPDPRPTNAPVMVWIHGGAWTLGEGLETDSATAGDLLARETGVIVVSMNYRLGQLGFLAHPALDAESADHVSGNYGLLDQQAALRWVHDNIAAFGGDPANVTVFGESAGGSSVCAHLVATASRGLYQRAILESGPCDLPMPTLAEAETLGGDFAHALGCDTAADVAACMRAVDANTILGTLPPPPAVFGPGPAWGPNVDGHLFPHTWVQSMQMGDVANVPVMLGWNRDEGTIFIALQESIGMPPITDAATYRASIAALVGDASADMILAMYPPSAFGGDPRAAAARALGDGGLICPARRTLQALAAAHVPLHTYLFTYPDAHFLLPASFPLGAFHSAEVQFVFGHAMGGGRLDADGMALHAAIAGYWTRFAKQNGDPNGAGAFMWPTYDAATGARIVLDRTMSAGTDDYESICAFWATIVLP